MTEETITYKGVVSAWELDHFGHMNVRYYAAKFDDATWNFAADMGLTSTYIEEHQEGIAALEQNIKYMRELRAGVVLEIRSVALEVTEKTFRFRHEMYNRVTGDLAASCELLGIYFDLKARKAMAMPQAFADFIRSKIVTEEP